jgi:hypothetical protein
MSVAGNWDAEEKERYLLTNMFTIAVSPPSHYMYRLCLLSSPHPTPKKLAASFCALRAAAIN